MALKSFLSGQCYFAIFRTGFGKAIHTLPCMAAGHGACHCVVTVTNLQQQLFAIHSRCFFLPTGKDTAVTSVSKFRMGINKFKVYRL